MWLQFLMQNSPRMPLTVLQFCSDLEASTSTSGDDIKGELTLSVLSALNYFAVSLRTLVIGLQVYGNLEASDSGVGSEGNATLSVLHQNYDHPFNCLHFTHWKISNLQ